MRSAGRVWMMAAFRDHAWMSPGEWAWGHSGARARNLGCALSLGTAGSCPLSTDLCLGIAVLIQKQGTGA